MFKKIALLITLLLTLTQVTYALSTQMKGDIQTKRLNEGTVLRLRMADSVTSQGNQGGDPFSAVTVSDIKSGNKIVLPAGTILRGSINEIQPAKRLSKGAIVYLHFDHLVTTTGKQLPIKAGVYASHNVTIDGGISAGGNYATAMGESWDKTCNIVKTATLWGWNVGEGVWNKGGRILLAPIGAIGGALGGGLYLVGDTFANLIKKGKEVNLYNGQVLEVMLLEHLDIPIS